MANTEFADGVVVGGFAIAILSYFTDNIIAVCFGMLTAVLLFRKWG